MGQRADGFRRYIFVDCDVMGYALDDAHGQNDTQETMISVLDQSAENVGLDRNSWDIQRQGGDSEVSIVEGDAVIPIFVDWADEIARQLKSTNRRRPRPLRIRMAVHAGLAGHGPGGYTGPDSVMANRMAQSTFFRRSGEALPRAPLMVALSDELYRAVVAGGYAPLDADEFVGYNFESKEVRSMLWLRAPGFSADELRNRLSGASDAPTDGPRQAAGSTTYNTNFHRTASHIRIGPTYGGRPDGE